MNLEKWYELRDKTADLSLRERAIMAGTAVVIIAFIWLQTGFADYEKKHKANLANKASLTQETVEQSNRLSELTSALAHDPNAALRQEQEQLKERLQGLRLKIGQRMSNLVAPEDMANLMKKVLSDYKGLSLLSAKNLPVEPLNVSVGSTTDESDKTNDSAISAEPQAVIFTHGFEMELRGTYFQTVEYLQQLESLSGFYWRMLSYKVDRYPNATIKVQLSTLSLEEDWIGV